MNEKIIKQWEIRKKEIGELPSGWTMDFEDARPDILNNLFNRTLLFFTNTKYSLDPCIAAEADDENLEFIIWTIEMPIGGIEEFYKIPLYLIPDLLRLYDEISDMLDKIEFTKY